MFPTRQSSVVSSHCLGDCGDEGQGDGGAECLGDGGIDTASGVNCSVPLTRHGHVKIESEE